MFYHKPCGAARQRGGWAPLKAYLLEPRVARAKRDRSGRRAVPKHSSANPAAGWERSAGALRSRRPPGCYWVLAQRRNAVTSALLTRPSRVRSNALAAVGSKSAWSNAARSTTGPTDVGMAVTDGERVAELVTD